MSVLAPNYGNNSTDKEETQGEKLTMTRYQSYKSNVENNNRQILTCFVLSFL